MTVPAATAKNGPRAAFRERANRAVARMAKEMPEHLLMSALSEGSDLGAIARVIASSDLHDPGIQIDPLAPAAARALKQRQELVAQAGEMMSSPQVGALLGISRTAVDKRRTNRRLLALRIGPDWHYPAFQFEDGEPLVGMAEVLSAMAAHDPWAILDELLARDSGMGGRSLLDILREKDVEALALWKRQIASDGYA